MNMLEISGVSKHFGEKSVLNEVSFSVPENTVFGFVGLNGAGKTTTMKIILGLIKADSGEVRVNGELVRCERNSTNKYIGYLPDVPEFYSFMTPREYLAFCGEIAGMDKRAISSRTEELLTLCGLAEENHRIKGFSRGMKQRLGIAQAMLHEPKLLICDEPSSALDPMGRKEIMDILHAAGRKTTVLFSTHILSDAEKICDEVALLHKGRIVLKGRLDEIRSMRRCSDVLLDIAEPKYMEQITALFGNAQAVGRGSLVFHEQGDEEMCRLMKFLSDKEIVVNRLERLEPDLETVFMEAVSK